MAWSQTFNDNFTRADSATVGNGWTDAVGGIWSISGNTLLGSTTDTAGYYHNFLTRPGSEARQDQRLTWRGTYGATATGVFGACLRYRTGPSYYLFGFSQGKGATNNLFIFRVINGAGPSIATSANFGTIADGTPLLFDVTAVGVSPTVLTFTVSNATTSAVLSTVTVSDSTAGLQDAAGVPGLSTWADGGSPGVTRMTGATTYAATASTVALPNDPAVVYSPYNWAVTSTAAKTINPGAYFRTVFSGSSCALTFDVSNNRTPLSQLSYRIDSQNWTSAEVASSIQLTMPSNTATWPKHTLEVVFKSMSLYLDSGSNPGGTRWAAPQNTALLLTGIVLDGSNGSLSLPAVPALSRRVLVYGDSIPEGYRTVTGVNAAAGSKDTDASDARLAFAYLLREAVGAEVGVVAFSGQGITQTGNVDVPVFSQTLGNLWAGTARDITTTEPDLILIEEGGNDRGSPAIGSTAFISGYVAALQTLLGKTSQSIIACIVIYQQNRLEDITTAVQQVGSSRVKIINTVGLNDPALSSDATHPYGVAHSAIATGLAVRLRPLLDGAKSVKAPVYRR